MYATSWCPYCRKARTFFRQANIPFTEYDVEKSPRAYQQYEKISGRGVPVIQVGNRTIQGFDEMAIRSALNELNQSNLSRITKP
ncbi:MAG: glutaredoxin domain-containing protein [Pseudomonadales bacterium]